MGLMIYNVSYILLEKDCWTTDRCLNALASSLFASFSASNSVLWISLNLSLNKDKMYSSRSIWVIWVSYFEWWGRWLGAGNARNRGILSSPNGRTRLTPLKLWRWRGNIRRAWCITKVIEKSCINCTQRSVVRVESFASSRSLWRRRNEELFRSVWDESFATFTLVKFRAEKFALIT